MPPKKSSFELALAARKKEIKLEELNGAAKQLYNDQSLTTNDLELYAKPPERDTSKASLVQRHTTYKRS
jgi:hypothetical protein